MDSPENSEALLSQIYERFKPSKKLPLEFEEKMKKACLEMMAEAQRVAVQADRGRMLREFEYFVQDRPIPSKYLYPSAL